MLGSILPHRLESLYLHSAVKMNGVWKNVTNNATTGMDECDPIPSTQPVYVVVANGLGDDDAAADPVKAFLGKYAGLLQQLGFSGFMGVCSALALKRVSREAATVVGFAFAGIQALSYYGYLHINYDKVTGDAKKALDVNGDGKLDEKDLYYLWDNVKEILAFHLPNAGSFSVGFFLGLRYI